jgi:hypothetical protein
MAVAADVAMAVAADVAMAVAADVAMAAAADAAMAEVVGLLGFTVVVAGMAEAVGTMVAWPTWVMGGVAMH